VAAGREDDGDGDDDDCFSEEDFVKEVRSMLR
jgi:hypothetical protein